MRNVFKVVGSVASAALLLSGAAMAAPPASFGGWTVDSAGVISDGSGCPGAITGAGFEQCQVSIGGQAYVRTRIIEGFTGTPTFTSEDFVRIGGSGQGLASTMTINDATTNPGTTFGTTAEIMTGWATSNAGSPTANKSEANLSLSLDTPSTPGDGFSSTFNVTAITDSTNANLITDLGIGQTVELGSSAEKQRFELRNVPASAQVVWIGQSVNAAGSSSFGVTQSKDLATGTSTGSATSLVSTAPDTSIWTSTFGAAPTF